MENELGDPDSRGLVGSTLRSSAGWYSWRLGAEGRTEEASRHGRKGHREGAVGNLRHRTELLTVVARFELPRAAPGPAAPGFDHQGQAADRPRLREFDLDPGLLVSGRGRKERPIGQVAVRERNEIERPAARGHFRLPLGEGAVVLRRSVGDDRGVGVEFRGHCRTSQPAAPVAHVLVGSGRGGRPGQNAGKPAVALDPDFAPDVLFHGLRRSDPRSSAFAPSGRSGDSHFQVQPVGQRRGVPEGVLPLWRHEDEPLLDDLRSFEARVEVLEAGDARPLHPFEVGFDPFRGDVPVHPVPPDAWFRAVGRVLEAAGEGVVRALRADDPRSHEDGGRSGEADPYPPFRCLRHRWPPFRQCQKFVKCSPAFRGYSPPRREVKNPGPGGAQARSVPPRSDA
jgi:hypothetical protein